MPTPILLIGINLIGLVLTLYPTLFSGFVMIQNDPGDSRLLNYVLEHGFRWMTFQQTSLWDMPFFYPTPNTGAYTDIMVGVAPFYGLWRVLGFAIETAFQLFQATACILNFTVFYLWLRRGLGVKSTSAAAAGSFVFAYSFARTTHFGHMQLIPQFYSILTIAALGELLRAPGKLTPKRALSWSAAASLGLVGQFYTGFYLAWFLILGLAACGIATLSMTEPRAKLHELVRRHWPSLAAGFLLAAIPIGDLARHFLAAGRSVGFRSYGDVMLPTLQAWFYPGHDNWLYGWLHYAKLFYMMPLQHEQALSPGWVTLAVAAIGWRKSWGSSWMRVGLIGVGSFAACATQFYPGLTLWRFLFPILPGANAIRALMRISLLVLIPISVGVAQAFSRGRFSPRKMWILALFIGLEQGHYATYTFSKPVAQKAAQSIADRVDPNSCRAFIVYERREPRENREPHLLELDAMMASLRVGVPTINGYSGNAPQGQDLQPLVQQSDSDARLAATKLEAWSRTALPGQKVCSVTRTSSEIPETYGGSY